MKKAIFFDAGCTLINLFEASSLIYFNTIVKGFLASIFQKWIGREDN
ncbi:hypothetical protein [Thermoflavimicrobium daqui]|nr:hypothetical protein [Thermoflavimicrobium daqui]